MIDSNQDRSKFVGGSEVAAVMGLSRWNTPLSVWAKKTGQIEDSIKDNEAVEMGIDLEDFVAKKFEQRSGKKVRVENREFVHPDYPYMVSHIDRWVVGEDGADLECKTCSAYKYGEWDDDEIPDEYYLQKIWYSGIIGLHRKKKPKDSYIAVLIGGQKFVWKPVKFDQVLFDLQVERVREFWESYVLTGTPPMAISNDKDTLIELFPESRPDTLKTIRGGDEEATFNELALNRTEGKNQVKEIIIEVDDADNKLRQLIGDDEGLETGQWKATWKGQNTTKVDTAKMKEDGIYEKYAIRGNTRVLRVVEKKGK